MRYGATLALDQATFQVKQGEVAGLLGPNGAGKSTSMKILTTFLSPSSGTAQVAGLDIRREPRAVRQLIGYLPENLPLYLDMEAAEYLGFVATARGLTGGVLAKRLDWVREKCGLLPVWRSPIRQLSKGYRQRVSLAQALVHDPRVIILDEPTTGLDPHQILEIRSLIRDLARNRTILLSTHILQEAEALADRIIIIHQGRIAGQGSREELRRQLGPLSRVRLDIRRPRAEVEKALSTLAGVERIEFTSEADGVSCFTLFGPVEEALIHQAWEMARQHDWELSRLTPLPFTLEETFLQLTRPVDKEKQVG
jgi:ABC-2 type transport system ATP-binding protein